MTRYLLVSVVGSKPLRIPVEMLPAEYRERIERGYCRLPGRVVAKTAAEFAGVEEVAGIRGWRLIEQPEVDFRALAERLTSALEEVDEFNDTPAMWSRVNAALAEAHAAGLGRKSS